MRLTNEQLATYLERYDDRCDSEWLRSAATELLARRRLDAEVDAWCAEYGIVPNCGPREGRVHPDDIDAARDWWASKLKEMV